MTVDKDVIIYPNSKPWVTKEMKPLLLEKKNAFKSKDQSKEKERFKSHDSKTVWSSLKTITGFGDKNEINVQKADNDYLNEMNSFFARFEDKNGCQDQAYDVTYKDSVVIDEW